MQAGRHAGKPGSREWTGGGLVERLRRLAAVAARDVRRKIAIWQKRRRIEEELGNLDDRALADLGLIRCQAALLAGAFPAASHQLGQVLARLRLSVKDGSLDRLTYHDLYRTCTMCVKRHRCVNWLASAKGAEGYPSFCPNGWKFLRLLEARRRARVEAHEAELLSARGWRRIG